ncbi:MAG: ribose 5-phosphate isomerase B [Erysipelotrichaceae bacterium]|nr:ribose 5-phosphate isomerase B [Erysipelotrichaceae bacterium]MDE6475509.1 ribose 5-phosphate isomerase B [Erysipelotrichaceae bacterium]
MKIALACDHGAFEYKEIVKKMLEDMGHSVEDFGTHGTESMDYPDTAGPCAKSVAQGKNDRGIVICGTGIGVSIVANKIKGIRCALCSDPVSARLTREHNDSNVLAMGQRVLGVEIMKEIVQTWIETEFSKEKRHVCRIEKVMQLEEE